MGRLILLLIIILTGFTIFYAPWATGISYVINSLLQPQYVWPWVFQGIPIFTITAGLTIIAFIISLAQKKIDLKIYNEKQNWIILIIWVWMHLSDLLSPYKGEVVSVAPEIVLGTIDSILIMYFILLPILNNEKGLKYLCYSFIFVGGYYIYWANSAYINQEWHRFSNNRLTGPFRSPYADENALSALIVVCMPFLILLFFRIKNKALKFAIAISVPLSWHAIILFSSRSSLLASVLSLLVMAFVIKSKKAYLIIAGFFIGFIIYQGSLILDRATSTIEIAKFETEKPINPRLISWEAGLRLIPEYPVFGAGVQMFEVAVRDHFPGMTPHVAHNTFINFSANTGILTGLLFLGLVYLPWRRLHKAKNYKASFADVDYYAMMASSISMVGFFVCSMFLDLIVFEPFYIILIINLIAWRSLNARLKDSGGKN